MKENKPNIRLRSLLRDSGGELFSRFQALWKFSRDEFLNFLTVDNYTDHGKKHALTVEKKIAELLTDSARKKLSHFELFCLLSACSLHDIGMIVRKEPDESIELIRPEHHIRVKKLLKERHREFQLNEHEAMVIGEICFGHGISSLDELDHKDWSVAPYGKVNISFLTALLRIGDLLDLSFLRAPSLVADLRQIKGVSLRHWNLHKKISNIEIEHRNKEILIYANAENEHDLSELSSLRNWIEEELIKVKEEFAENEIFLDQVCLRTKFDKKKVVLSKTNPFIRLDSFDWEKHAAFFGREKEIENISRITAEKNIIILVGESGVGKTSLLNAGLKQKLIEDGVYVFESRVTNTFSKEFKGHLNMQFPNVANMDLLNSLKEISESGFKTAVFFDQFEEIFTLFKSDTMGQEILDFIKDALSEKNISTKIIVSLREDFLAEMWEVSDQIPQLYDRQNTFRLKKLTRENATQIIYNTVKHIKHSINNDLVESLLEDFTQKEESIYPPYIQIVCHELFKKHKTIYKEQSEIIPLNLDIYRRLEGSEKIMSDYFEEILDGFSFEERTVINEILARMITFFYTKQRISYEQITEINKGRIEIDKTLTRLIKHRIIKKIETELNDEYELIHDFLAKKIMQNKPKQWLSSKITRAIEYINDNFHEQISLQEMAEHLKVSREHFCRLFKVETGRNFVDYLNKRRINEVEDILKSDPRIKLIDIYTKVGFSNTHHLTKTFKSVTGVTPTEYRRKVIEVEI